MEDEVGKIEPVKFSGYMKDYSTRMHGVFRLDFQSPGQWLQGK